MAEENQKPLLGKILLTGSLKCITGLHIGASKTNLDIGGLDGAVVRDPLTRAPYIPGSSLKGKLRSLFERGERKPYNRSHHVGGQEIRRHECTDSTCVVCRLFGASKERNDSGNNLPARLLVRDCHLTQISEQRLAGIDTGLQYTEWKFENALDRVTAAAMPRQLERVPAGAEFQFEIVYNVEISDLTEISEDLTNILNTLSLLQEDYLGGHGSRGYGKIVFNLDQLSGKKVEFYSATDAKTRGETSITCPVKTVNECKEKLPTALQLFSRGATP